MYVRLCIPLCGVWVVVVVLLEWATLYVPPEAIILFSWNESDIRVEQWPLGISYASLGIMTDVLHFS